MNDSPFFLELCVLHRIRGCYSNENGSIHPDIGDRAWPMNGYDFGVTGVGVKGGAGGAGETGRGLCLCS